MTPVSTTYGAGDSEEMDAYGVSLYERRKSQFNGFGVYTARWKETIRKVRRSNLGMITSCIIRLG